MYSWKGKSAPEVESNEVDSFGITREQASKINEYVIDELRRSMGNATVEQCTVFIELGRKLTLRGAAWLGGIFMVAGARELEAIDAKLKDGY